MKIASDCRSSWSYAARTVVLVRSVRAAWKRAATSPARSGSTLRGLSRTNLKRRPPSSGGPSSKTWPVAPLCELRYSCSWLPPGVCPSQGSDRCFDRRVAPVSPGHSVGRRPSPLAGQVFRSLLGELPMEDSGGLANFDHVAVRVSHVAADFSAAIDRRRDELGPL